MWFRFFLTTAMYSCFFCIQITFAPYTNSAYRVSILTIALFQWVAGLQAMIWYYWGKRWEWKWGDMSDDRRIRAASGTMFTSSIVYSGLAVYQFVESNLPTQSAIPTGSITGTLAYLLMGFAFFYLNVITNRSSQACLKILEESKAEASQADSHNLSILSGKGIVVQSGSLDGIHQSTSHTSLSLSHTSRRHSTNMNTIRQSCVISQNDSQLNNSQKNPVSYTHLTLPTKRIV